MASPADICASCASCGDRTAVSSFDLTVADDQGVERHFFGVPAAVCRTCGRLVLDQDVERLYRIGAGEVLGGIVSDRCLLDERGLDAA